MCRDQTWGTVCANGWSATDARVVCRHLEFSGIGKEGRGCYRIENTFSSARLLHTVQMLKLFKVLPLDKELDQYTWTMLPVLEMK